MNQALPSPRPLELRSGMWIAILMVCLVGVNQFLRGPERTRALGFLDGSGPPVVRSIENLHRFPALGIEVEVTGGWTYLSIAQDLEAMSPTFMHRDSQSILRLQPFPFANWPLPGAEIQSEDAGAFQVEWSEVDHRRVGRMRKPPVDLAIFVVTHKPHAELTPEVRDFCRRIREIR